MRNPEDEITGLTKVTLHKWRDWDSNFDCSASLKPWSFQCDRSLCSIKLDVHATLGTILGPDSSSMSELGLWRQERSESGVRSTESPALVTPLKTKPQPHKGENGLGWGQLKGCLSGQFRGD